MVNTCKRMIADRIKFHFLSKDLIHKDRLIFLPFRNSHSAIAVVHSDIQKAKKAKEKVIVISLYIHAAYDSVYIDLPILNCAMLGIRGRILKWIYSFLTDRKLKVLWRKCYLNIFPLYKRCPSGVCFEPGVLHYFYAWLFLRPLGMV